MNRDLIVAQLRADEGEVLHAYKDSNGYWTIGVGRLIDQRRGGGITKEESDYLLNNDIDRTYADLIRAFPWMKDLDDIRQNVLLNMAFNLGIDGLRGFKLTLAYVRGGHYELAAGEMLKSLWAKQVGARAQRLARMMRTGVAA